MCSELETIVTNWIGNNQLIHLNVVMQGSLFFKKGKAIGLPDDFLALNEDSTGGGVIQVCSRRNYTK